MRVITFYIINANNIIKKYDYLYNINGSCIMEID